MVYQVNPRNYGMVGVLQSMRVVFADGFGFKETTKVLFVYSCAIEEKFHVLLDGQWIGFWLSHKHYPFLG
jgi:hypothetical protein